MTDKGQRLFALRFDIDSYRCLVEGVPHLARLAAELDCHFTFFISMGRAISRRALVRRRPNPGAPESTTPVTIGTLPKLGMSGTAGTALLNPRIGANLHRTIRNMEASGHEVGLHGGRNHGTWIDSAQDWSAERLGAEVDWGLEQLHRAGVHSVAGFSSPGWVSPTSLPDTLARAGFRYIADRRTTSCRTSAGIPNIATTILGEPGGVGYLEWCAARQLSHSEVQADFRVRLHQAGPRAVAYDHPFWAGVSALDQVKMLIETARAEGYTVVPMRALASA